MFTLFFLLGYSCLIICAEAATREGMFSKLRAASSRPFKVCPEAAGKWTDGGGIIFGLVVIMAAMATVQSLIDAYSM